MKKIIAINASPRTDWNTAKLVKEAAIGTKSIGADVDYIDLYNLEKIRGCVSCFGCKQSTSYGKCVYKDDIYDVLGKIRQADGLIIGSPIYIGNMSSGFLALYERIIFQSLTYNIEKLNCNEHMIPVLMIVTSNLAEEYYNAVGYDKLLENYKNQLSGYVGPTKLLTCGNTLQVNDYDKYNWTIFNPEEKIKHHNETFSTYLEKAYAMGIELLS